MIKPKYGSGQRSFSNVEFRSIDTETEALDGLASAPYLCQPAAGQLGEDVSVEEHAKYNSLLGLGPDERAVLAVLGGVQGGAGAGASTLGSTVTEQHQEGTKPSSYCGHDCVLCLDTLSCGIAVLLTCIAQNSVAVHCS